MSTAAASADLAAIALVETIEGWLAPAEIALLLRLAAAVPRGQAVVEIGNYRGRSTVALALGARRGAGVPVYSIDPHEEFTGARGGRFGPDDQAHLYANLTRAQVGSTVKVVSLPSVAAGASWSGPPVGLLFVDGDHRYPAVRADLDAWRPHLAPGASVVFDDCDYADVARLVRERTREGELEARDTVGKMTWLARPGPLRASRPA